jgi:hypothetical protein
MQARETLQADTITALLLRCTTANAVSRDSAR